MHWNEKIDFIKRQFSYKDFSVPSMDRKRILRTIETKFITIPDNKYNLNESKIIFSDWWKNLRVDVEFSPKDNLNTVLQKALKSKQSYWIAIEFSDGSILIYKATLEAIDLLIEISQTWADTFHIIQLKYDFVISIRNQNDNLSLKFCGNEKIKNKLLTAIK